MKLRTLHIYKIQLKESNRRLVTMVATALKIQVDYIRDNKEEMKGDNRRRLLDSMYAYGVRMIQFSLLVTYMMVFCELQYSVAIRRYYQ